LTEVVVLRWGHRRRDERLTTHVALTARAFNASGLVLADVEDHKLEQTIKKLVDDWGGSFFLKMGVPWRVAIEDWRAKGWTIVQLTAYGEHIEDSNVMDRIRSLQKDVIVIVGSQKVPDAFFSQEVSDFNVAVGNQPHSECSSLAIFLDRLFESHALSKTFENAKLEIIPQKHGKRVIRHPVS
jgi:tRNA (cytidine56-2'-O)-methyltransferase